jgi:diguanylate cyclase (GGDEF)-like protein/PAS domain S-box-containing protein
MTLTPTPMPERLNDQLHRYAEDFTRLYESNQRLLEENRELKRVNQDVIRRLDALERSLLVSRDIHISTDDRGSILEFNPAAAAFLNDADPVGKDLASLLPVIRDRMEELLHNQRNGGGEVEWVLRDVNGDERVICLRVFREEGEETQPSQLRWMFYQENKERYADVKAMMSTNLFYNLGEAIMFTDLQGIILAVNSEFTRITGYASAEVVGKTPAVLKSGVQDDAFYQLFWRELKETGNWQGEILNRRKNGDLYAQWLSVNRIEVEDGAESGYVAVFADVSREFDAELQLNQLAYHDRVTQLPNRALFIDRLDQAITLAKRQKQDLWLAFIDLDNFREIHRVHGRGISDQVLHELSLRLKEALRESDSLARYGTDEFAVILPGVDTDASVRQVLQRLLQAISHPMEIEGRCLQFSASIGCARYPESADGRATLLQAAIAAMYRVRLTGGAGYDIAREETALAKAETDNLNW